jgi:hypothetical protein
MSLDLMATGTDPTAVFGVDKQAGGVHPMSPEKAVSDSRALNKHLDKVEKARAAGPIHATGRRLDASSSVR